MATYKVEKMNKGRMKNVDQKKEALPKMKHQPSIVSIDKSSLAPKHKKALSDIRRRLEVILSDEQ